MKQETAMLLDKARRAIGAARALLERGDADFAIGRAYYAMFYTAEALLVERELRFRKHSGVQAAFGEHFAKPGLIDSKFHRYLLDAASKRLSGDYGVEILLESEDVLQTIEQAEEFAAAARVFLDAS
jgi:uncharacterized protein (UPF0332 family)